VTTSLHNLSLDPPPRPIPPHLKEISSLASWTVSTHKPLCGTTALRHPSPHQFWQSDGPQPHTLNIHFFKLVSIAHLRFYVDSKYDESYTPTKMQFLAGTGHHDLQSVCEIELPPLIRGWTDVDLSVAGGPRAVKESEVELASDDDDEDDREEDYEMHDATSPRRKAARLAARKERRAWKRIGTGPTLRCFLVQLRILENNQNGKDTHLRGLQLFARDESYIFTRKKGISLPARAGTATATATATATSANDGRASDMWVDEVQAGLADDMTTGPITRSRAKRKARSSAVAVADEAATSESVGSPPEGSKTLRGHDLMRELEMRFGEPELR